MKKIFTPIKLAGVEIKNRILIPSMCVHFNEKDGHAGPSEIEFVRTRARGGVGMIVLPGATHGKISEARTSITDDRFIGDWETLSSICHEYDCRLFCQLHPAKAQAGRGEKVDDPTYLTHSEIDELIAFYVNAAIRAKRAGVDGVDIHGAHAHEIAMFSSQYYNHRTDEYGGSVKNRSRFACRVIEGIKNECGKDYPVTIRISGTELIEGGRTLEESGELAGYLEEAGADAINVSIGMPESGGYIYAPMDIEDCFNVKNASYIKKCVSIPVIAVDRIVDIEEAVEIIENDQADMVAMARAHLADAELVNKYLGKNTEPEFRCIACCQGCKDKKKYKRIVCMQNPLLGREEAVSFEEASEEDKKKKIVVVGAGPAGLEFACNLARRGLKPMIFERESEPGGLILTAAKAPHKENMIDLITPRVKLLGQYGIQINCNVEVTTEMLDEIKPDVLAIATGSKASIPPIKGLENSPSLTGDEAIKRNDVKDKRILVIGAGMIGCEVCDHLLEKGAQVFVVDIASSPCPTLNKGRRQFLLERINSYQDKIEWHLETAIKEISYPSVVLSKGDDDLEIDNIDMIVVSAGRNANLQLSNYPCPNVFLLGDASGTGTALEAIYNSVEPAVTLFR